MYIYIYIYIYTNIAESLIERDYWPRYAHAAWQLCIDLKRHIADSKTSQLALCLQSTELSYSMSNKGFSHTIFVVIPCRGYKSLSIVSHSLEIYHTY